MFSSYPNLFVYAALLLGVVFLIYSLYESKKLPLLTDLFAVMLSVAAAYSGIELCFLVLEGTKTLGDFEDQRLLIVLGGIAVFWVALLTVITMFKQVKIRAEFSDANL